MNMPDEITPDERCPGFGVGCQLFSACKQGILFPGFMCVSVPLYVSRHNCADNIFLENAVYSFIVHGGSALSGF